MSASAGRPWLSLYREGTEPGLRREHATMLAAFRATAQGRRDAPAVRYFDGVLSFGDLDDRSDALAAALQEHGFARGDRLGVYVQNDPAFLVAYLAAWKAGGAAVAINPMNRQRELTYLLEDSGASALLCLDELWEAVAAEVVAGGGTQVRTVVTCSALDDQTRDDPRLFADGRRPSPEGTLDLGELLAAYAGRSPSPSTPAPEDVAVLTYTSGTTGRPKGAMNTQANLAFNAQTYRDWMGLDADDVVLGVAPLFHITGMVGHFCLAMLTGCPLVLAHRFEPQVVLDAMREHRPTFTVGAITVFIALGGAEASTRQDWSSLRAVYSGGAPIAPAVTDRFEEQTGLYVHNIYGLTRPRARRTRCRWGGVRRSTRRRVRSRSGCLSSTPSSASWPRTAARLRWARWARSRSRAPVSCPATGSGLTPRRSRSRAASCAPATWGSWMPTAGSTWSTARRT